MISKEQLEQDFAVILKASDKNSRLAWIRKNKKMSEIIEKLQPIENELLRLQALKKPLLENIEELRQIMVRDCPHMEEYLIHHGKYIECKFCGTKIGINRKL